MAGIKISSLPAAPSAQLTDVFPVDQLVGGTPVTYKETLQQVFDLFGASGQPLTRVSDTNITLTLGGTPATALLAAVSITAGWTGTLSGTRGGTGVNNGSSTITVGGNVAFSGAFTFTGTLTGNTGVTFPTSGTLATTSQLPTPAALTEVDDTNVTLTLAGNPATSLLQAVSITAGWTGTLSGTRGGTGVNNGASTITLGGSLTTSGAFASTFTMTNTTAVTFPTSGTLATTSQLTSGTVTSVATNNGITGGTITTTGTIGLASIAQNNILSNITGGSATPIANTLTAIIDAAIGSTQGDILYRNGTVWTVLAPSTSGWVLTTQGASANPVWAAGAGSGTVNSGAQYDLAYYATAGTAVSQLATANSSGLLTNGSGIPAWVTVTGTGAPVLGTSPTISAPLINQINDQTNNAIAMSFSGAASAVNYITVVAAAANGTVGFQYGGSDTNVTTRHTTKGIGGHEFYNNLGGAGSPILSLEGALSITNGFTLTGGATGVQPIFAASGSDSNIDAKLASKGTGDVRLYQGTAQLADFTGSGTVVNYLLFQSVAAGSSPTITGTGSDSNVSLLLAGKGTGGVGLKGYTDASSASAGYVGEVISSTVTSASPSAIGSSGAAHDLTSIALTAGDWDVYFSMGAQSGTTVTAYNSWISTSSATLPDLSTVTAFQPLGTTTFCVATAPSIQVNVSGNQTVYGSYKITYTGSPTIFGKLWARRRR